MKHIKGNDIQDKPIITIEDTDNQASSQSIPEEPVFSIANLKTCYDMQPPEPNKKYGKWKTLVKYLAGIVVIIALVLGCYKGIKLYYYYHNPYISISVSPSENIKKLDGMKQPTGASDVVLKTDSVLGVALNIYELHNVKAGMTLEKPDTADHSVIMYTRTADHTATGKYLGSLVINGEEKQSDVSRLGYCAIVNGNMVIGISRFDDVKKYAIDHGGSFFRQFMLISNGELPRRFFLHGKVERKALARTANDELCIIETRHPETLWDFADALREYGYIDAIYLTGGADSGFFRASDGTVKFSENAAGYRAGKYNGIAPWLVLKKTILKNNTEKIKQR